MMTYSLYMQGYWLDANRHVMPSITGIYCVYACTYDSAGNTVFIRDLLYIGQAEDVNLRLAFHNKRAEWFAQLAPGEDVCYGCAQVDGRCLDVVEAVMVYCLKPVCNDNLKWTYSHLPATVTVSGRYPFTPMSFMSAP